MEGPAYFGSWTFSHEIPDAQRQAIRDCPFLWISHGHPDHLSAESLRGLSTATILLPDHVGGRIKRDLEAEGLKCTVMADGEWLPLSERVRVLCLANVNQDAVLLIDVGGRLVVNTNDAQVHHWPKTIRRIIRSFNVSYLTGLTGYGDADMINFFEEDGSRIATPVATDRPVGPDIARRTESFGCDFFIPSSSMHRYQRTDSVWANDYATAPDKHAEGFESDRCAILPAYVAVDCASGDVTEIEPAELPFTPREPSEFGDDWDEPLQDGDGALLDAYFRRIEHLGHAMDFLTFRVGGREHTLELAEGRYKRGIVFETPRASLMSSIEWEVFDDLLIGNFTKTTLVGEWGNGRLYPDFTPFVAKYADNGHAYTEAELDAYRAMYKKRAPLEFMRAQLQETGINRFRSLVPKGSALDRLGKRVFLAASRRG